MSDLQKNYPVNRDKAELEMELIEKLEIAVNAGELHNLSIW